MRYVAKILVAGAMSFAFADTASAGAYEDNMARCLQSANKSDAATVMLQCEATAGKLAGCTVLDNSMPGKGFDKAAICVAMSLPMGTKTGTVKIPIRFPGGG